jgi:DNA-binding CsgD family transcriptional regulator
MLGVVERLDAADASALLAFVSELKDVDDALPFPPRVLRGLRELIPSDDVTYSELDPLRRRSRLQVWTDGEADGVDSGAGDGEGFDAFWLLRSTHPVCGYRQATGNWRDPLKASDFVTLDGFRRTAIYDALYRGELDHWFDFGLPAEPDRTRVFIFVRHGGADFDERDRLVATLVRPHLEERAKRATAAITASAALAAVEDGVQGEGRLVVLCTAGGVIEFASPAARSLLRRYLGVDNGRLPPALLSRRTLAFEDGDTRLCVRVARTGELRLLLLDEQDLRLGRLTPREREILDRVAAGRTNAEIAFDLEIARATVAKHLEHVYEKLGVRTRTAAAAALAGERRAQAVRGGLRSRSQRARG